MVKSIVLSWKKQGMAIAIPCDCHHAPPPLILLSMPEASPTTETPFKRRTNFIRDSEVLQPSPKRRTGLNIHSR
ncbi:unnamed protein product [Urochloa humidicola]